MGRLLEMTEKEVDRYRILREVEEKRITQKQAADFLGLSDRQIRNLLVRVRSRGAEGVVSQHRGKQGNHSKGSRFKRDVLALIHERYGTYGPTFVQEKLEEWHGIQLSEETVRLWMIECGLWIPRSKGKKVHLPRKRRECFGELIQADGSHHYWFGDERPLCNLTVYIDDATGMLTGLFFSETETLEAYFAGLRQHIERYGRPRALYTDRYAVFQATKGEGVTQMQKALKTLGIELILANSPQAKGRVERANKTLQDRLVKELELRGITTIEGANKYAKIFIEEYNRKFSKKPMHSFDAHRPLEGYDLDSVLCRRETRTLLSDGSFQCNSKFFIVQGLSGSGKGKKVEVCFTTNREMRVFMEGKEMKWSALEEVAAPLILSRKEILAWQPRKSYRPPASHPWKQHRHLEETRKRHTWYNKN